MTKTDVSAPSAGGDVVGSARSSTRIPRLEFSAKYGPEHAQAYYAKHRGGLRRRLTHWGESRLIAKALRSAGHPKTVLDLPCGAGRFWPLLLRHRVASILAMDNSPSMIATARAHQDLGMAVLPVVGNGYAIPLPDASVDAVVCMRLLHHIGDGDDRLPLLRELRRVTRQHLIVSLWIDGNIQGARILRRKRRANKPYQNRFVRPREQVEDEFRSLGLVVVERFDLLPLWSPWRLYVLHKTSAP